MFIGRLNLSLYHSPGLMYSVIGLGDKHLFKLYMIFENQPHIMYQSSLRDSENLINTYLIYFKSKHNENRNVQRKAQSVIISLPQIYCIQ